LFLAWREIARRRALRRGNRCFPVQLRRFRGTAINVAFTMSEERVGRSVTLRNFGVIHDPLPHGIL